MKPTREQLLGRPVLDPCKPGFCLQQRCGAGKHTVRALDVAVDNVEHALGKAVKDDRILEDGHPEHVAAEVVARHVQVQVDRRVAVRREVSGWMRCFTRDRSEARGQRPLTPLVRPSLNVLEAHPRQRSDRSHKWRRPSRSPRESPRAQLQKELPSRYKYK